MPTNVIMQMKWTNQFLKKSKLIEETDKMDWPIFIKENALSINISLPKKKKYQAWWFQWLSSIKYLRKKYH